MFDPKVISFSFFRRKNVAGQLAIEKWEFCGKKMYFLVGIAFSSFFDLGKSDLRASRLGN